MSLAVKLRNDIILVLVLLTIAAAVLGLFLLFAEPGSHVIVTIDGKEYGRYPLSRDVEIAIVSPIDESYTNVLVIKDGRARVERANCPDGICARHRSVRLSGESIVCLPHRLAITVVGSSDEVDMDV